MSYKLTRGYANFLSECAFAKQNTIYYCDCLVDFLLKNCLKFCRGELQNSLVLFAPRIKVVMNFLESFAQRRTDFGF